MKMKWMTLTALTLALSSTLALAAAPGKPAQNTGTRSHVNEYHDRTPRVHERGTATPR